MRMICHLPGCSIYSKSMTFVMSLCPQKVEYIGLVMKWVEWEYFTWRTYASLMANLNSECLEVFQQRGVLSREHRERLIEIEVNCFQGALSSLYQGTMRQEGKSPS